MHLVSGQQRHQDKSCAEENNSFKTICWPEARCIILQPHHTDASVALSKRGADDACRSVNYPITASVLGQSSLVSGSMHRTFCHASLKVVAAIQGSRCLLLGANSNNKLLNKISETLRWNRNNNAMAAILIPAATQDRENWGQANKNL